MIDDDEPIDFSALDPEHDPDAFDRAVARIVSDGMAARRRARPEPGVLAAITMWTRPLLAVAAIVTAVAIPALLLLEHPAPAAATGPDRLGSAEAAGIPGQVAAWASGERSPTPGELVAVLTPAMRTP